LILAVRIFWWNSATIMGLLLACKAINKYGTKSGMNKTKKPFNHLNKRFLKFIKVTPYDTKPEPLNGGFEAFK